MPSSGVARVTTGVLDDATDLTGPGLGVGVRCAWVLRTARLLSGRYPRLEDMAAATGSNPTRLHRLETAKLRDGGLVDAYERALDLPPGLLRAPIDVMCRTFPALSPRDLSPGSTAVTVGALSALTMALLDRLAVLDADPDRPGQDDDAVSTRWSSCEPASAPPTGGDWLTWARALAEPAAIGLPEPFAARLVRRLVDELCTATGHGYPTRYEALSLLRCSAYGHVVLEVARELMRAPEGREVADVMSAVGEAVTPDAVSWCLGLLADERGQVVTAAALALENMAQVAADGPAFWAGLVRRLASLLDDCEPGSPRHGPLTHLWRLVPASVRATAGVALRRPLAPDATVGGPSRHRADGHRQTARAAALRITDGLGLPEQPLLARLVVDIAVSPYGGRAVTSAMLLGALPAVARPVCDHLALLADEQGDPVIRERVTERLVLLDGATCGCLS